jgi:DNA-binding response OmpR family regulator
MGLMIVNVDREVRRRLRNSLVSRGCKITQADRADGAIEAFQRLELNLVLLHPPLGEMNLGDACRTLRVQSAGLALIAVSSDGSEKIAASNAGADDFLMEPFDEKELVARIGAVMRRCSPGGCWFLNLGDVEIDFLSREVRRGETTVDLTEKEFKLLKCLVAQNGEVVSQRKLLQYGWGCRLWCTFASS